MLEMPTKSDNHGNCGETSSKDHILQCFCRDFIVMRSYCTTKAKNFQEKTKILLMLALIVVVALREEIMAHLAI